ncbi:MAG: choice-of-anchor D domain-containing protein [Candidatus Bipolaricaulota bacterium]|nr:choice-of-anchor D domain-containing protein [Candidatus Bipolaricaulota bacterium]
MPKRIGVSKPLMATAQYAVLMFVVLAAFSAGCAGMGTTGNGSFRIWDGTSWVEAPGRNIGHDILPGTLTIPSGSTAAYLFVIAWHDTTTGYVEAQCHSFDPYNDIVHVEVVISATGSIDDLHPTGIELVKSTCIDAGPDNAGYVGVVMNPESGHTWDELPLSLVRGELEVVECCSGCGAVAAVGTQFGVIRERSEAYANASTTDPIQIGTLEHPFRDLKTASASVIEGTVYLFPGTYKAVTIRKASYEDSALSICPVYDSQRPAIWGNFDVSGELSMKSLVYRDGTVRAGAALLLEDVDLYDTVPGTTNMVAPLVRPVITSGPRVELRQCRVRDCYSLYAGGTSDLLIEDCTIQGISGAQAIRFGQEEQVEESTTMTAVIRRCTYSGSSAPLLVVNRHSIYASPVTATVSDSLITSCTSTGSLFTVEKGGITLQNCTVAGNDCAYAFGGTSINYDVQNCIIYDNTFDAWRQSTQPVRVAFSDIEGGLSGWATNQGGNIAGDPLFFDAAHGDYHLGAGSPCLDSASPLYASASDIEGRVRIGLPDMGAYEGEHSPGLEVLGNGTAIAKDDVTPSEVDGTDFGSAYVRAGTVDHTFTIRNAGLAALSLTGDPRVSVEGTSAGDFSVTSQPRSSVAAAEETTFTVRFDPNDVGVRIATINIVSDDTDSSPFSFSIQGTGVVPSKGDVDGSGVIDALDIRLCLEIVTGVLTGTADQREACDVDDDNDVDMTDAQILAEYVLGLRSSLP